jgi:uncharacterized membrane protein YcaP (DUF421 family)
MLFSSWQDLGRVLVISLAAYIGLVFLLRISGNRTLSKMNSFDFIITITLGSTFAAGILQKTVSLAETLTAFAALVGVQYVVTWLSVRSETINKLVKTEPTLVFRDGHFLLSAMKKARVTHDEIEAAIRREGLTESKKARAVILESNGELNVIPATSSGRNGES